jgi:hypothetical protein
MSTRECFPNRRASTTFEFELNQLQLRKETEKADA